MEDKNFFKTIAEYKTQTNSTFTQGHFRFIQNCYYDNGSENTGEEAYMCWDEETDWPEIWDIYSTSGVFLGYFDTRYNQ